MNHTWLICYTFLSDNYVGLGTGNCVFKSVKRLSQSDIRGIEKSIKEENGFKSVVITNIVEIEPDECGEEIEA